MVEGIMEHFRLRRPEAVQVLQSLEGSRHLKLVPGTQRILMAFPFSAVATPFRVRRRNGREYYANCAWDAVAFHAMLDEDIRIEGRCHHCAKPFAVELSGGRSNVPAMEPLIYLSLPGSQWWNDIVNTCSNHMVFFAYLSHLDEWRASNPESAPGATLTVDQTHALGFPIYRDKMKLDYTRPGKDQLVAHFRDLGLSGEFWQL